MRSRGVTIIGVALLPVLIAAAVLLAGCGTRGAHLPHVSTAIEMGPKPGVVTVRLTSSGDGFGIAQVILTHPGGHRTVFGNGVLEDGVGVGWTSPRLPAGDYDYTIYAVPSTTSPPDAVFPESARTEENVFYRGTFTID